MTNTAPTIEGKAERIPELTVGESFRRFARGSADFAGSAVTFFSAAAIILLWALARPYFQYSDSWQLVINTATTIITFLMVFLIQNTQNRDAREIHLKLDELIRSHAEARNQFISLEKLSNQELEVLAERLLRKAQS